MPTVSNQLDLLCWNNGLSFDVKCLINGHLQRGILQQAMMEITDPKMHRDIKRCIKQLKWIDRQFTNYGRFMLHIIYPTFHSKFHTIDGLLSRPVVEIGGVGFKCRWWGRGHSLEFNGTACTQKKLVKAINNNINGRKIKDLKSKSKPELFTTLLTLPEFRLDLA